MGRRTQFREEDGVRCVDIHLREARQLFDLRDPAPFHERDLDEKAVEYLSAAMSDIRPRERVRFVFVLGENLPPELSGAVIQDAARGHFQYELDKAERALREHLRRAQLALAVGLLALAAFLGAARLAGLLPEGTVRAILEEGLTITGWVALWRPLELIAYEWWPIAQRRGLVRRLLAADVAVKEP
jgi:hypothetical protein